MPQRYAILWRPIGPRSDSAEGLARQFGDHEAGGDQSARLTLSNLEVKEAAEIAKAPEVIAIAPEMATRLIEPFGAESESDETKLWGLEAVGAENSKFTGKGVRIAVLDTGIETQHPAFSGISIAERDFTGSGNGDRNGHGTHCAGTIFGRRIGEIRIGVAPGIDTALIAKVLRDNGRGTSLMILEALKWSMDERADIVSMSVGLDFPGQVQWRVGQGWPIDLATSRALEDYRMNFTAFEAVMRLGQAGNGFWGDPLIVVAAGNESKREIDPDYRIAASLPAAICDLAVGAIGWTNKGYDIAKFSNCNPHVTAPGVNIKSAWIGRGTRTISGTSMACPHVAGVAALWFESLRVAGRTTRSVVKSYLIAHAKKQGFAAVAEVIDVGQGLVKAP